jgi:hypothetical protein
MWQGFALGVVGCLASVAHADIASDRPAAIVVFPKLLVDTANGLDTLVRLSNTSNDELNVLCFYVNVTPRCIGGRPDDSCFPDPTQCSGLCVPQWQETDFALKLTGNQPTAWLVSEGEVDCQALRQGTTPAGVCSNDPNVSCDGDSDCAGGRCVLRPCFPLDGFFLEGPRQQDNAGSRIPPSPEDPFIGELKCIAVDATLNPTARNHLKGEVLIGRFSEDPVDNKLAGYNAIGIPAIEGRLNRDNTLVLGGTNAEYEGCPNILIMDHFFDGAVDPLARNLCRDESCTISGDTCNNDEDCEAELDEVRIATDLTLIPCTQDFRTQDPDLSQTVAQILVFNEFEQRFSTSRTVNCFRETRLSNLDTPQNDRSIFSAGVAGTLTGQTRIRGVLEGANDHGNTLLGVAEEFRCGGPDFPLCGFIDPSEMISSSAFNLHFQGIRPVSDFLYLP